MRYMLLVISLLVGKGGLAQEKNLCICFERDTKYIEVSIDEQSGEASFSITRPGYETKQQREMAYKRFRQNPTNYPVFTIDYLSYGGFDIKESFDSIPCAVAMSVEGFRNHTGSYPNEVNGTLIIKKVDPERFMVWEAMVMPVE